MSNDYTGKYGEKNFERDFILKLQEVGWEDKVLLNPSEEDLIENWKNIIFDNNRGKLNNIPLSDLEMEQVLDYVKFKCSTPVKANIFINGKNIVIKRDLESSDVENAGKEVYLDIFDHVEIAGGRTRYQIAEQPDFKTQSVYDKNRRGDLMLLINGLPVIHIELKASGVNINNATSQIQNYAKEGVFTGIFGLIQVFFAITPEDALYFANPGEHYNFNNSFYFHWADEDNIPISDWRAICKGKNAILSIPEAHQLIGYFTVADKDSNNLMVVRSYQYYAIRSIIQKVKKQSWGISSQLGGYIWNTTGAGKTLTSFKTGQLLIDLELADKVVFLVDRVELNNQSLEEYNSFARDGETVQETTSSNNLFMKLKSKDNSDRLIVTSIQKLSKIDDDACKEKTKDLEDILSKKIVFLVDEAHRSQFGVMHEKVKRTFNTSLFIGFTGTPIFGTNDKNGSTTESVFGTCLDIYSLADGIRDNNVLGFDPKAIKTYKDYDLRESVALRECNALSKDEVFKSGDSERIKRYKYIMSLSMLSTVGPNGEIIKGIEDYLPAKQYNNNKHREEVVNDILNNWDLLSTGVKGTKFHALLSTDSIEEACAYYKLFKARNTGLRITSLFDPSVDNYSDSAKADALTEIVDDYNIMFNKSFNRETDPNYKLFKKDVVARLAHKKQYNNILKTGDDNTLDLLIVVEQLLTGFDSKYLNTLYLDRVLETDKMIQAISRTNRVLDNEEKPFGIFRFYRKPYTMQKNLEEALQLYCEGDTCGVVIKKLDENISDMNNLYFKICKIFNDNNIKDFCCLPKDEDSRKAFKKEFYQLKIKMNTIRLQGFKWNYDCSLCEKKEECLGLNSCVMRLSFTKNTYDILLMRYNDLAHSRSNNSINGGFAYDIDTYLSEMDMAKIDSDYLESHFRKVVPVIASDADEVVKNNAIYEFEKELPRLTEIHQNYARRILDDIRNSVLKIEEDSTTTLMEYIYSYIENDLNHKIKEVCDIFGLDIELLYEIYNHLDSDLNEFNRFENLLNSADIDKVKLYFNVTSPFSARGKLRGYLLDFFGKK